MVNKLIKGLVLVGLVVLIFGVGMVNGEENANVEGKTEVDSNLVGYWKFDEGEGEVIKDSSGNGNDGKVIRGITWVPGKFGYGINFDGDVHSAAQVSLKQTGKSTDEVTLSLWLKWEGPSSKCKGYDDIVYASPRLWVYSSGKVLFNIQQGIKESSTKGFTYVVSKCELEKDKWYHIACTFKDGLMSIYIDGKLDNTRKTPYQTEISSTLFFGYLAYFQGIIDNVKLYNKALTAEEIAQAANPGEEARWQ